MPLVYYVFDLLHLDGRNTASLPLIERKALLQPLVAGVSGIQFNDHETGDGELIRRHAWQLGFEGVVSKTMDAPLSARFQVGAVGYIYDQLTGDGGSGAKLGLFESRVIG